VTDDARERARRIRPEYAEGPLVRVARAAHQAESEMMESLLLDQGIPALSQRAGGFDVPDFLAAGPRDVLVPASAADAARAILGTEVAHVPAAPASRGPAPWVRVLAVVLAVLAVAALVAAVAAAVT
jgi:pimeloyl-ACP methyl ester carboxylesterase